MTQDELNYWLSETENSRFKWKEDAVFRLNGRGSFYYTGGEDGIYMKIGKDGLLEGGTYEGAFPHIGEAMFKPAATKQYADYSQAFTAAMEAGGKQFLIDMFTADAPVIPLQAEQDTPERMPPIRAFIGNADDMAAMFADVGRLKDGVFKSTWIDFPTTAEAFRAALKEIGVDGEKHTAYSVLNYKTDIPGLLDRLPFGADADEINYLAYRLQHEVNPQHIPIFEAVMQSGRHCGSLRDIINVTENLDLFDLQPACSVELYGEFLAEMKRDEFAWAFERLNNSSDPDMRRFAEYVEQLEKYFDATAYARDVVQEENGQFLPCGYLTESGEFVELYSDKHDIPDACRVSPPPVPSPQERPSALGRLAAAKEAVAKKDAERSPSPDRPKARGAEL